MYVMSVNHVTSKAAYASDYKGILDNLTIFFSNFFDIMYHLLGNYGIRNRFSVYRVRIEYYCEYYYDMQSDTAQLFCANIDYLKL